MAGVKVDIKIRDKTSRITRIDGSRQQMEQQQSKSLEVFPRPPRCPANYHFTSIAELYAKFKRELEGRVFVDPNGRRITFRSMDFPHLVKLEFNDTKQKRWVEAVAKRTLPTLDSGTLDESRHRIGDASRSRTLFWVPDILQEPDSIHPNKRNTKHSVYAKRYERAGTGRTLKIVLVQVGSDATLSVQTSFWSDDIYHKGCVAHPASHPNRRDRPKAAPNTRYPGTRE